LLIINHHKAHGTLGKSPLRRSLLDRRKKASAGMFFDEGWRLGGGGGGRGWGGAGGGSPEGKAGGRGPGVNQRRFRSGEKIWGRKCGVGGKPSDGERE